MAWTTKVLSREVLFKEVWAETLGDVAERYGIGPAELVKICDRLQVPRPPQGHWARIKAGRTEQAPELQPLPEGASATHEISEYEEDPLPPEYASRLLTTPPPSPERPPLKVATELPRRLHPVAEQLRKRLGAAEKGQEGYLVARGEELIAMKVTVATRKRALLVMDALLREFDEYGATSALTLAPSVARPYSYDTGRAVRLIVTLDDNKYELVVREPLRFVENPDREWRALSPRVRKTTGELLVRVEGPEFNCEIRDSRAALVEARLDGLFAKLPEARLRAANARVRGEWRAVVRAAEEAAREAAQRALQLEEERRQLLTSQLARWRTARDVRDFVSDMRARAPVDDPTVAEFLDWCTGFVVELDPATQWDEPRDAYGRKVFFQHQR